MSESAQARVGFKKLRKHVKCAFEVLSDTKRGLFKDVNEGMSPQESFSVVLFLFFVFFKFWRKFHVVI